MTAVKNKIQYAYFVDHVSRKFTLVKNKCSQNNQYGKFVATPAKYMGGAVRQNSRFGYGIEKKNYMFLRFNPRTSAASSDETLARQAFGLSSQAAVRWAKDLSQIATIVAAWKEPSNGSANGVHKNGYTLRGWLFAVAYSYAIEQETIPTQFPAYVPAS